MVEYNVDGFVERNKDVFYTDLIELMQSSQNNLVRKLFPDVIDKDNKKRPITAGSKIKTQVSIFCFLLLMKSINQAIGCLYEIKPISDIYRQMNL